MRKRRTYSRRRAAVRWIAALMILIPVMSAVLVLTDSYCITPEQTLRYLTSKKGLSPMEIIYTQESKSYPKGDKTFLVCRNEDHVALNSTEFSLRYGWHDQGISCVLDPADPEARHHVWTCGLEQEARAWICLFGFVPDGETAPTFRAGVQNGDWEKEDRSDSLFDPVTYTPVPTIPVEGGAIFLEEYLYEAPKSAEEYELEYFVIDTEVCIDGQWQDPCSWTSSSY